MLSFGLAPLSLAFDPTFGSCGKGVPGSLGYKAHTNHVWLIFTYIGFMFLVKVGHVSIYLNLSVWVSKG